MGSPIPESLTPESHLRFILNIAERGLQNPDALKLPPGRFFHFDTGPEIPIIPPQDALRPTFQNALELLGSQELPTTLAEIERQARERIKSELPTTSESGIARRMIEDAYAEYALQLGRSLAEKTLIKGETRYFPLSFAAPLAQAPESTIRYWITQDTKFEGKLIKAHTSPANGLYVSEDSVRRMARRFVRYLNGKPAGPAGPVIVGETDDQRGYIGLTDAARTLGVERHTIWRWAMKGTAPEGRTLDIIKDPASDQFYISEKDVSALSQYVPRTGLSRGPRPQPVLQT
jgi:hypothetical protein